MPEQLPPTASHKDDNVNEQDGDGREPTHFYIGDSDEDAAQLNQRAKDSPSRANVAKPKMSDSPDTKKMAANGTDDRPIPVASTHSVERKAAAAAAKGN
jgi:hypothetical protein